MKGKNFLYKIGLKSKVLMYKVGFKPKIKRYGYRIKRFQLPRHGLVKYAQWLHPAESEKEIKEDVVQELSSFLDEGDFCIDIGAHTGDTTVPMALAVGRKGCVLALEPNKYVYPVLEKNSNLNSEKTNIIPIRAAATSQDGEYEFAYMDPGFCNGGLYGKTSFWKLRHSFKLQVTGINLSYKLRRAYRERLEKLKFIKIDTEGYDLPVMKSIEDIIDQFHPFIRAEIHRITSFEHRKEIYNFLTSKGYTISKISNDSNLREFTIGENDLTNWKHYDVFCIPNTHHSGLSGQKTASFSIPFVQ